MTSILYEPPPQRWATETGRVFVSAANGPAGHGPIVVWNPDPALPGALGLELPVKLPSRVMLRFRIRARGVKTLQLAANTGRRTYVAPVPARRDGWREVTLSSQIFSSGFNNPALNAKRIASLGFLPGEGAVDELQIEGFRIEEHPRLLEDHLPVEGLAAVEPHPLLAAHTSYYTNQQDADLIAEALVQGKQIGIGMMELPNMYWIDFEKGKDVWEWSVMDKYFQAAEKADVIFVACAGGLKIAGNPANLTGGSGAVPTPSDMSFEGDFTKLLPRYKNFLDHYFDRYGSRVRYFTLHSEGCTRYFDQARDQVASYTTFLEAVTDHVHSIAPGVLVGTCIHDDETEDLVKQFSRATDLCVLLFQPGKNFVDNSYIDEYFDKVLQIAGSQKLAFNETYTNSSLGLAMNEELQAEFVTELFRLVAAEQSRFQWITWWSLHDDDRKIWKRIGKLLGDAVGAPHLSFMLSEYSTCGLLRKDGSPKPAAKAWAEALKTLER